MNTLDREAYATYEHLLARLRVAGVRPLLRHYGLAYSLVLVLHQEDPDRARVQKLLEDLGLSEEDVDRVLEEDR